MGRSIWAPIQGTSNLNTAPSLSMEIICLKKLQHLFSQINFFWVSQVLGGEVCLLIFNDFTLIQKEDVSEEILKWHMYGLSFSL